MSKSQVPGLAVEFLKTYDAKAKDMVWQQQSSAFRKFWSERVLASGEVAPLADEECDAIIRILDRNGRGNTRESEAVARAMVPQGAWRRLFREIRSNKKLGELINGILVSADPGRKAVLIDQLYKENEEKRNHLTGPSGNTIGAFLAAYNPVENLCVISIKDRSALIEFLGLSAPFDWDRATIGCRIAQSNDILREGLRSMGVVGSARTMTVFCYSTEMKALWKEKHTVKRTDKSVSVTVPENGDAEETPEVDEDEIRESLQIQALLADIGSRMGLKIWLPKSDRVRVLKKWKPEEGDLLDELPLNYDDTTLHTIEQIDVLWLKHRSIVRAFEVEHTTSVYSGLLRMADLIALQPNMRINLHIVAPESRREKVFQEIQRPVFQLLEGGALSEVCTYISYDAVRELRKERHLNRLTDDVIEDYHEKAE